MVTMVSAPTNKSDGKAVARRGARDGATARPRHTAPAAPRQLRRSCLQGPRMLTPLPPPPRALTCVRDDDLGGLQADE